MRVLEKVTAAFGSDRRSNPYRCLTCETAFEVQYHVCPNCGGFSIDPIES